MTGAVRRSPRRAAVALFAFGALWLVCGAVGSGAPEPEAQIPPTGAHRVWVTDRLWHHSALFDGDTAQVLGMIDSPYVTVTPKLPMHAHRRGEI
jgi:hypothetical protein